MRLFGPPGLSAVSRIVHRDHRVLPEVLLFFLLPCVGGAAGRRSVLPARHGLRDVAGRDPRRIGLRADRR
jgi:hypothetical protein